jgi:DNA-binding LytR/AlgR family response regulator
MEPARILIVENEFIIAEKLSFDLGEIGYTVTDVVSSGLEAVKSVKSNPPDLIIMDIKIEGELDGIDTAKLIQKEYSVPVIFLTGFTEQNLFMRAMLTHPASYLTKPYNRQDIYRAIELALFNAVGKCNIEEDKKPAETACILNDRIFLKDNKNCFNKVAVDDIYWIKGDSSYSVIETKYGKFLTSNNLKTIENKICNSRLARIHRSYLINLLWVKQVVGKNYVIMDLPGSGTPENPGTKVEIPIGPEYRDNISRIIRLI